MIDLMIPIDFSTYRQTLDKIGVILQLWDMVGDERLFRNMRFLDGAHGVILCIDSHRPMTPADLQTKIGSILMLTGMIPIQVVYTKCDSPLLGFEETEVAEIPREIEVAIQQVLPNRPLPLLVTSSKRDINVRIAFAILASAVNDKRIADEEKREHAEMAFDVCDYDEEEEKEDALSKSRSFQLHDTDPVGRNCPKEDTNTPTCCIIQ